MQGQPISCFYITFTINGNYAGGSMLVTGEMKVCQVIMYFFQYFPWVQHVNQLSILIHKKLKQIHAKN